MTKKKKPLWRRILSGFGLTLVTVLLLVVFYVTVVLGQPQPEEDGIDRARQALMSPSPAIHLEAGAPVEGISEHFPVAVLGVAPGAPLHLMSGVSYDTAYESGVARVVTLVWMDAQGREMTLSSIYPARALSLLADESFRLVGEGVSLAGYQTVRMEKNGQVRLHFQTGSGLYAVTLPAGEEDTMREMVRTLQLQGGASGQ